MFITALVRAFKLYQMGLLSVRGTLFCYLSRESLHCDSVLNSSITFLQTECRGEDEPNKKKETWNSSSKPHRHTGASTFESNSGQRTGQRLSRTARQLADGAWSQSSIMFTLSPLVTTFTYNSLTFLKRTSRPAVTPNCHFGLDCC